MKTKNQVLALVLVGLVGSMALASGAQAGRSKMSGKEESRRVRKSGEKAKEAGAPVSESAHESKDVSVSTEEKSNVKSAEERAKLAGEQSPASPDKL